MTPTAQRRLSAAATESAPERGAGLAEAATWATAIVVTLLVATSLSQGGDFSTSLGGYAWRLASLLLSLALVVSVGFRLGSAGRFLKLFAPWIVALVVIIFARFGALDPVEEFSRQMIMLAVGACVFAGARSGVGRALITRTMWALLTVMVLISLPPAWELLSSGWSWEAARYYKWIHAFKGLAFNTNFAVLAMLVIGLWSERKAAPALWWAGVLTLVLGSVLFATRAPLISTAVAAALGAGYAAMRRAEGPAARPPLVLPLLLLLVPLGVLLFLIIHPEVVADRVFNLRSYLWQISLVVWRDHPIFGAGVEAMHQAQTDSLNIPNFVADFERLSVHTLRYGGFHNLWLEALATKGLVGFLGLLSSYFLLMRLALARAAAPGAAPLLVLVLLLFWRGLVEVGGPYSYQISPLDFVAMMVLAWCAAVAVGNFGPASAVVAPIEAPAFGARGRARFGAGTARRL